MFGYESNLISIMCMSGGTTQKMADKLFKKHIFNFMQVGNSVVLSDKWSDNSHSSDSGGVFSKTFKQHREIKPTSYDSGRSIYKRYILDKIKHIQPDIKSKDTFVTKSDKVIYNYVSKIYHKPGCEWAQKCDENCIKTGRRTAIANGGHPCVSCRP